MEFLPKFGPEVKTYDAIHTYIQQEDIKRYIYIIKLFWVEWQGALSWSEYVLRKCPWVFIVLRACAQS